MRTHFFQRFFKPVSLVISALVVTAIVIPQLALAKGTIYVDADTGDDNNRCVRASAPCQTLAGAKAVLVDLGDPSDTTIKLKGTFNEAFTLNATAVTAPDTLDGLHLTAWDKSNRPTIAAADQAAAIDIYDINNVEINQLIVSSSTTYGIKVTGSSDNIVRDLNIHHNKVHALEPTGYYSYGIYTQTSRDVVINHNTIEDITLNYTDETSYHTLVGIESYGSHTVSIRNNTIKNLSGSNTGTVNSAHGFYLYGVYVYGGSTVRLKKNTLSQFSINENSTVASASHFGYIYGVYINDVLDVNVNHTTLTNVTSTATLTGAASNGTASIIGLGLYDIQTNNFTSNEITQNTLTSLTASVTAKTASSQVRGFDVDTVQNSVMTHNTLTAFSSVTTATEDSASVRPAVYGFDFSQLYNATIADNTIKTISTTADYSAANGSSITNLYLINLALSNRVTIADNSISSVTATTLNHDQANYYDTGATYGINVSAGSSAITIQKNTIKSFQHNLTTAGTDGSTSFGYGGIYSDSVHGLTIKGNTIKQWTIAHTSSDNTSPSQFYEYLYGIFVSDTVQADLMNNTIKAINFTVTGGDQNTATMSNYLMSLSNTSSATVRHNTISTIADQVGSHQGTGSDTLYGMTFNNTPSVVVEDNKILDVTSEVLGDDDTGITALTGMYFTSTQPAYIISNSIRALTSSNDNDDYEKVYGIHLVDDGSQARLYNNIILGSAAATTQQAYGIYSQGQNTNTLYVIHNTISNWFYPVYVGGGQAITLKNNILAAVGNNSAALAVAYDHVQQNSFASNYNRFFNATKTNKVIYDVDNSVVVAVADWQNKGGSWGYDGKSTVGDPALTPKGYLKVSSKARDRGTSEFDFTQQSADYQYLQTDRQGQARWEEGNIVDVGADEYKE